MPSPVITFLATWSIIAPEVSQENWLVKVVNLQPTDKSRQFVLCANQSLNPPICRMSGGGGGWGEEHSAD